MKEIIRLSHQDQVSGTSIMNDGTKCYWTEGPGGDVRMVYPDGRFEAIPLELTDHPIIAALTYADEHGFTGREMNIAERIECDLMLQIGREVAQAK